MTSEGFKEPAGDAELVDPRLIEVIAYLEKNEELGDLSMLLREVKMYPSKMEAMDLAFNDDYTLNWKRLRNLGSGQWDTICELLRAFLRTNNRTDAEEKAREVASALQQM